MDKIIEIDDKFTLYKEARLYKTLTGIIKNTQTNEVFEGEVNVYEYINDNGYWEADNDIYELGG